MISKEALAVFAFIAIVGAIGIAYFLKGTQANEVKTFPTNLTSEFQSKLVEENQGINSLLVTNYMDANKKYFKGIGGKDYRTLGNLTLNGYVVIYTGNEVQDGTTFQNAPVSLNQGQIAIWYITNNNEVENCTSKWDGGNYIYLTGGSIETNKNDDAPICRWFDSTVKDFVIIGKSTDLQNLWTDYLGKRNDVKWVNFGTTLSGMVIPLR